MRGGGWRWEAITKTTRGASKFAVVVRVCACEKKREREREYLNNCDCADKIDELSSSNNKYRECLCMSNTNKQV